MTKRNTAVISGKFELLLRQHMKLHGTGGPGSGVVLSRARAAKLADMQPATLGMAVSRERIPDVKVLDREQMRVVSGIPFTALADYCKWPEALRVEILDAANLADPLTYHFWE